MSKLLLKNSILSPPPSMRPQIQAPTNDELTGAPPGTPADYDVVPKAQQATPTNDELPAQEAPVENRVVDPASQAQAEGELSRNQDNSVPYADSSTAPRLSSSDGLEETTSTLDRSADDYVSKPDSFLESNWHFILLAVVFVGWVLSLLITKRDPSFKPRVIREKEKALIKNPRGKFKKSERFLKSENNEELAKPDEAKPDEAKPDEAKLDEAKPDEVKPDEVEAASELKDETSEGVAEKSQPADTKIIESKLTNNQQADIMQTDQPSDEEFDFDLSEEGGDSDAFDFEDVAEIDEPAQDKSKSSSSKRFKTEADVNAAQAKSDDPFVDDDEFVAFDDQDSQLSLADSDEEFGFDLDDEEPGNFLDSGNLAAEVPAEASQVLDGDLDLDDLGLDAGEGGLGDIDDIELAGDDQTAQEAVDPAGGSGDASGMVAAATAAGSAAIAAKKGGFFSRLFGGKNKKNTAETQAEDSPVAEEISAASSVEATAESIAPPAQLANVTAEFDESGALDASDALESAADSLGMGELQDDQLDPMGSLDSDDDFDFDLEIDDELGEPAALGEPSVDVSPEDDAMDVALLDSGELDLDLADAVEDLDSISDAGLDDIAEASIASVEQPIAMPDDELVASESLSSGDEAELDFDDEDSGAMLLNSEDSVEVDASTSDVELAEDFASVTPAAESPLEIDEPPKEEGVELAAEQGDSGDFGLGIFDDDNTLAIADESPNPDAKTSIVAPIAAVTVGAGIAGIAIAGSGEGSASDNKELQARFNAIETRNKKLSAQVADLEQQIDVAAKKNTESASLQNELDESQQQNKVLSETVGSLTSEKDELVKEKDSIDQEKKLLAEELATANEQLSTWEQEKADLLKRQEELTAEKEAATAELESAANEHEAATKELESLKAEIAGFSDERSSFESEVKALETKLSAAEAKPATADSDSGEDMEDLRNRFKLRLASELRKRKEALLQVDQAEAQRNEVAKLLRAAKAEIVTLKTRQDDDDFEIAD